jgi:hypothetical protein
MSKIALSGNASGTGTLTIAAPNTSTDRTLTLPDNTGTIITTGSTFAGTGPAFSAWLSGSQTLSSATLTKLQVNTEEFDTANCYDNATNYRFTPNVAGYYQVNGRIQIGVSNTQVYLAVYKNGAIFKDLDNNPGSSLMATGSCLIYLNGSTDYIELYGYFGTGQVVQNANASITYFQAAMVRAA